MSAYRELKGIRQVTYAVGHMGPGMLNQFITTWLLIFLASGEGDVILKSSLVGVCIMCGRIVDALMDPVIANWSDRHSSSKLGRRLPFILGGTLPMILSFNMLWYTPSIGNQEWIHFIWVLVAVIVFYFSYTVVVNPYFALLPEIAKDKKQRMFIQSFVALFGILGMGIAMGASGFLIDAFGYGPAGLIMSLICVIALCGPAVTVRMRSDATAVPIESSSSNLFVSVKNALANPTFRTYITGFCIFFFGFELIQYNLAFLTTVQLGLDKGMSSTLFISSVIAGLLFIPVYNLLLRRMTVSGALKLAILSYVIVTACIAMIPLFTAAGFGGAPLGFMLMALLGFPYSGLMVIPNVIISEIIDEDVRVNRVHREAMFFGVQGLINKLMLSIAALTVGVLLDVFGNTTEEPLGVMLISPIAAVFALIGYLFIRKLHITK
ncbi:MFS transporter [Paenibacillus sp. strain BS8-2]